MNIIVVGGGASGLMAAIMAAKNKAQVIILEQNEKPGKKILASGNGRCNLTNYFQSPSCYRGEYPEFAWNLLNSFGLDDTLRFFTNLGIYTKNKNGWIYPYSEQASSVLEVLHMEALHRKVKIKTNEEVVAILPSDNELEVVTTTWKYPADKVIIATGSSASSIPGSGLGGYQLAQSLGHRIIKPLPALVPLRCFGNYFPKWAGVRMECDVTLYLDDKPFLTQKGEVQFTDYGISGIPVFQLSRHAVRSLDHGSHVTVTLDLMPDFTEDQLTSFLESRMKCCVYKSPQESLIGLIPLKMIHILCGEFQSLDELVFRMKYYPLKIKAAHSMEQAQICSGGIDTSEVNPKTLESKLVPGVYFAGEVLDIDGDCGGYNLQFAWTSGAIAGKYASQSKGASI